MDYYQSLQMWSWACAQLNIREDATKDDIKKAYRSKAKMLHPDVTMNEQSNIQYLYVKNAYEYLLNHDRPLPIRSQTISQQPLAQPRQAKVLGNDAVLRHQLKNKSDIEKSKQKAKEWVPKEHFADTRKHEKEKMQMGKSEEEILNQIRAILIAEHIKRQIANDKEKKLYKAFMQHEILEQEDKGNKWE